MNLDLKIELLGTENPKVSRTISIPPNITFHQLHLIIQEAFGWRDSHLYQFSENGFRSLINIGSPHDEESALNAAKVSAEAILFKMYNSHAFDPERAQKLKYIYDFGDDWEHEITVIGFDRTSNGKPNVKDGSGACPPEDCGGIHGFADLKSSLKTGKPSEMHGESWIPWLEGCDYENYDPEVFDLKVAQKRVRKVRFLKN